MPMNLHRAQSYRLAGTTAASLVLCASTAAAQPTGKAVTPEECAYDRAAMLSLGERAFDQDMSGGWRTLAARETCLDVAADLIRDYREIHGLTSTILYWHEGQLRAAAGDVDRAVQLFAESRINGDDPYGWNPYVDATIAFLRHDFAALVDARDALARIPRPDSFPILDADGKPIDVSWPPNLDVVDHLIACFDQEYLAAYGRCEEP